jgi:hypothetical protein
MITTPDGVDLYTTEEMKGALEGASTAYFNGETEGLRIGSLRTSNRLRDEAINFFKNEVSEGSMDKESAESVFNGLANFIGWDEVDSLSTLWTVEVLFSGEVIASFADVEADDANEAESEVEANLSVDRVTTLFRVSYGSDEQSEEVDTTYSFEDEFDFNATEQ